MSSCFAAGVATILRRCIGTALACACSPSVWSGIAPFGRRWSRGGVVLPPAQFALLIEAMDWRRTIVPEAPRIPVQMLA